MISCDTFRSQFRPATDDALLLDHVRRCDSCLSTASDIDPDIMFRSIGGGEMIPPGGLDAFVGDVMREVRLRSTEKMSRRSGARSRRLAVAATIAAAATGAGLFYQAQRSGPAPAMLTARPVSAAPAADLVSRPVVEEYDSARATIVEVPVESSADVKVVMIFDEELPADL